MSRRECATAQHLQGTTDDAPTDRCLHPVSPCLRQQLRGGVAGCRDRACGDARASRAAAAVPRSHHHSRRQPVTRAVRRRRVVPGPLSSSRQPPRQASPVELTYGPSILFGTHPPYRQKNTAQERPPRRASPPGKTYFSSTPPGCPRSALLERRTPLASHRRSISKSGMRPPFVAGARIPGGGGAAPHCCCCCRPGGGGGPQAPPPPPLYPGGGCCCPYDGGCCVGGALG